MWLFVGGELDTIGEVRPERTKKNGREKNLGVAFALWHQCYPGSLGSKVWHKNVMTRYRNKGNWDIWII